MTKFSIPNSAPAIGQTSTPSSRRSRKRNSTPASAFEVFSLVKPFRSSTLRFCNAERSRFEAQRSIQKVKHSGLNACLRFIDVERCAFSFLVRRVKGAWWPSRSSKPSSPREWRGRFDSYPLRQSSLVTLSGARSTCFRSLRVDSGEDRKEVRRVSREQIRKLTSLSSCAG
jgi:hypothetical protein